MFPMPKEKEEVKKKRFFLRRRPTLLPTQFFTDFEITFRLLTHVVAPIDRVVLHLSPLGVTIYNNSVEGYWLLNPR